MKSLDELADEYVYREICYNGLEYPHSGTSYNNGVQCFKAGFNKARETLPETGCPKCESIYTQSAQEIEALKKKLAIVKTALIEAKINFNLILVPPREEPKSAFEFESLWLRDLRDAKRGALIASAALAELDKT